MNYLLDTHIFVWWSEDPSKLSQAARDAIKNPDNTIYVSSAAIWEIVIKTSLGRMEAPEDPLAVIYDEEFIPLPIQPEHAVELRSVEHIHGDPFDRIQIAQAKAENLTLITHDKTILKYADLETIKS